MSDTRVDKTLVKHLGLMARLTLSESEIEEFIPQLQEILESFRQLDNIDTNNIAPSFHPVPVKNVTRQDTPHVPLTQNKALKNVAQTHQKDGFLKGPRIL